MIDLLQCNPFRPVDALWQRAVGIVERNEPWASVNRDGGRACGYIKRAQRFWTAVLRAETHHQKLQLIANYPEMCLALRLYEQPDREKLRWAIEARILARQTNDEIAQCCGCTPETIETYEALFFNVRSRLDFPDFITTNVVDVSPVGDSQCPSVGSLWKLFAYLGGPHVLNFAMSGFQETGAGNGALDVSACLKDLGMNVLALKAAVAALTVPVDKRTQLPLMRAFLTHIKGARRKGLNGPSSIQIVEGLEKLVADLNVTYGEGRTGYKFPGVELLSKSPTPPPADKPPGEDPESGRTA